MKTTLIATVLLALSIPAMAGGTSATATIGARIIRPVMLQVSNAAAINLSGVDFKRGYVDLRELRVAEQGGAAAYQFAASVGGSSTGVTLARPEGTAGNARLAIASAADTTGASAASRVLYLTCNNY